MKKSFLSRIIYRLLNKMKKSLEMFDTQELLATGMLAYIFLDSNYLDIREFRNELLSVYMIIMMDSHQINDYTFLN